MNKYSNREDHKTARQAAILEAIRQESIATQNELAQTLRRRGIAATQVSVSRDIAEMGLIKVGGHYRPGTAEAGVADAQLPLRTWVRGASAAGPHLVVVHCDAGAAQKVGLVLDGLLFDGLLGTIAGDDTVFVATTGGAVSTRLIDYLQSRMKNS